MVSFRFTTLLVAVLAMVTFINSSAQARPLYRHSRGLLRPRRTLNFTNYDHLVRRQFGYTSSDSQHQARVRVVRRTTSDDHGDVVMHDSYESQQHALEAALKHYEEHGDAKSLQIYLNGLTGAAGGATGGDVAKVPAQDDAAAKKAPAKQKNSAEKQQVQQPQQQTQDHQEKQGGDDCEQGADAGQSAGSDGSQGQQQQQPEPQPQQPSPQQQPKKMKKVPKKHDSSNDWTQPSNPAPSQPQSQPQPQPQPQPDQSSSSGTSINGYTPPPFTNLASSPSTASLYTSSPFTGHATFYNTGLGACGIVNNDNEPIVAVSRDIFEQYNPSSGNPNHNSLCGKKVEISWKGKTVQAFATDECPSCERSSLDCSPSVFEKLDDKDKGVLEGISWRFV
ncbi:uncharacterized protein SRS1_16175 [Sporisorium reilianum f. sp. reilianum]|uniref:RlpA-like protein double-psi beta-barrel domain-containing protein n=1 Tax=Sporisorium reilianum f. sp. reilianum TaxID=72559 RepID=A0A2N8UL93_9BASI|nr:uncharacterized protein SRS1_16175 [Sporisorium reilianum f. sp. reilianum]